VSVVVADTYPNYSTCSILQYASSIFHAMTVDDVSKRDLSYTVPLGTRWDAIEVAAQNWVSNTGAMHNNALTA
jgi:hypothetical protein